jgi:hypothetical protein
MMNLFYCDLRQPVLPNANSDSKASANDDPVSQGYQSSMDLERDLAGLVAVCIDGTG